jgi:hypothetical protein
MNFFIKQYDFVGKQTADSKQCGAVDKAKYFERLVTALYLINLLQLSISNLKRHTAQLEIH